MVKDNTIGQKVKEWLLQEKHNGQESPAYFDDLKRLEADEPLAYVIGHIPFLNETIYLDSKPLIPRVETEFWVDRAIKEIPDKPLHILDIFSGSGCIGTALLSALPQSHVTLSELELEHIPTIQKNVDRFSNRAIVIESDVFSNITGKFDYIFANPPYIPIDSSEVESSVKDFEPDRALYAENNGLALIEKLIREAPNYLNDNGVLYIEINHDQRERIEGIEHGFSSIEFWKDQYERDRVVKLTL